jgi:membrane associated rhomboid family serine protease
MNNRLSETVAKTPPATRGIVAICLGIYALQVAMDLDLERFTMCPQLVLYIHEYYRIVTSALFHGNLMHIGMNMLSVFHLSTLLEQRLGTLPHLVSTLGAILLTSLVYISIAWIASTLLEYDEWMYQHSVGFSGVLFHFCVLECNLSSNTSRSIFGMFHVPTYVYPWVLLVLLQFFIPNLSFLGHLSGILTGYFQYYGLVDICTVGADLDSWSACSWLVQRPSFVSAPSSNNDNHQRVFQEPMALVHSVRGGCWTLWKTVGHILEAVSVCIFGRGQQRWNANIRLPQWTTTNADASTSSEGHVLGTTSLEDDEEWGGLPTIASLESEPLTSQIV